jgi:hypothetical protein
VIILATDVSKYLHVVFFLLGYSPASYNSDAWEIPKRKNTTLPIMQHSGQLKFEIKKCLSVPFIY